MKKIWILLLVFSLTSCEKVFFVPEPANTPTGVFNEMWNTFNELYGPFKERSVDWDAVRAQFAPQVNDAMSDDELFGVLASMIAVLNDGHVSITAPNKKNISSNKVYRDSIGFYLFDLAVIEQHYLNGSFKGSEDVGYVYGEIDGDLIYVFLPYVSDNMPIMDVILDEYPNAGGIIIDLRHSFGGDFTWGFQYLARFTNQERLVFTSSTKNGPGKNDFDPWVEWNLKPTGNYVSKPIVFLTDRYTISASERTVMALKVLPNATQIGDTTNGSHSTMIGRELQNGWYYTLPTQRIRFADGNSYEGIGMIPDEVVKNSRSRLDQGIDDVLNAAIIHLQ